MKDQIPPRWPDRFLQRFCSEDVLETLQGDLYELYQKRLDKKGKFIADLFYWFDVISACRPFAFSKSLYPNPNYSIMTGHYTVIAWRHLSRHKTFTAISTVGMAAGLAAFMLIAVYLDFELQFDRYHTSAQDIVRVKYRKHRAGDIKYSSSTTFFGVADFAKHNFPEVEHAVHFYKWPAHTGVVLDVDGRVFNERNYLFAGPEFFQVFNSLLKQGHIEESLKDPKSIVLSERLAQKMFGTNDVLGKMVKSLDEKDRILRVTGVMRDLPENSHFAADAVIPWEAGWNVEKKDHWKFPTHWTYMRLKPATDVTEFETKLNERVAREQRNNPDVEGTFLPVQPITDIHLFSQEDDEISANGNIVNLYALGFAAILVLVISWINYINLESSRFLTRIREVGVRKCIGASRSKLVMQFMIQYVMVYIPAIVIALIVVYYAQPFYEQITGVGFRIPDLASPMWLVTVGIVILGICVTALYPVIALESINAVQFLKGKVSTVGHATRRRFLLTFQFSVSMVLIALLLVITDQLDFMRKSDQLEELSRVLSVYNPTVYAYTEDSLRREKYDVFYNILQSKRSIERVAASSAIPGEEVGFNYQNFTKRNLGDPDDGRSYKVIFADEEYIPVYRLKLLAGRNYNRVNSDDVNQNTIILNESAIRALGFASAEEAVDQEIYFMVTWEWKKYRIIGVTEDYHHESVKQSVTPTIFYNNVRKFQMVFYSIRISPDVTVDEAIADIRESWKQVWPEKPFDYTFMDQRFDQQYKSEVRLGSMFRLFAGVAILLACLGIIGLTLFEVHTRVKEIGIRKVLGASAFELVRLLTRSYLFVTVIAAVVALPFTYWAATIWLNEYPVRIQLQSLYFVLPLTLIALLILVSSGFQTFRAASTNPVDALRHE